MATPVTFVGDKYAKQQQTVPNRHKNGANPRMLSQAEFKAIQPLNTSAKVPIRNMFWVNTPVEAGVVFLTSQGRRLVLEATSVRVLYVLQNPSSNGNNKIYSQPTTGFIADVVYYPLEEAGRNLQTIKKVAEFEMQIIIGIFSVTSWGAFSIVLGMDVLDFAVRNQAKFPKWTRIIKASMQTRKDLKRYAPTLYEKLLYSTLLVAWEGTKFAGSQSGEISETLAEAAITDSKVAGRGAGILAGKLGMNAMNGRIGVLSAAWAILFTVATKALAAIPGATQSAVEAFKEKQLREKAEVAQKLLDIIKRSDIQLTKDEAMKIVSEVYQHPNELKESLSNLAGAFKDAE